MPITLRYVLVAGETGLAGLVNNAGIASFGPLEQQSMQRFEEIVRVNVFGVQALTRAPASWGSPA